MMSLLAYILGVISGGIIMSVISYNRSDEDE